MEDLEVELKTKYFGKIIMSISNDERAYGTAVFWTEYKGKEILFILNDCIYYKKEKLSICLEIIDKYIELDKIVKQEILEKFSSNETINGYFKSQFDIMNEKKLLEIFGVTNFKKIDIKYCINKFEYPFLDFNIINNKVIVFADYYISPDYWEYLHISIDEDLNIIDILHEK